MARAAARAAAARAGAARAAAGRAAAARGRRRGRRRGRWRRGRRRRRRGRGGGGVGGGEGGGGVGGGGEGGGGMGGGGEGGGGTGGGGEGGSRTGGGRGGGGTGGGGEGGGGTGGGGDGGGGVGGGGGRRRDGRRRRAAAGSEGATLARAPSAARAGARAGRKVRQRLERLGVEALSVRGVLRARAGGRGQLQRVERKPELAVAIAAAARVVELARLAHAHRRAPVAKVHAHVVEVVDAEAAAARCVDDVFDKELRLRVVDGGARVVHGVVDRVGHGELAPAGAVDDDAPPAVAEDVVELVLDRLHGGVRVRRRVEDGPA